MIDLFMFVLAGAIVFGLALLVYLVRLWRELDRLRSEEDDRRA